MAEKKYNTHVVLKNKDIVKYLTDDEVRTFNLLEGKIERGRIENGKKPNNYYVCNADEPYADKVLQVILDGEDAKHLPGGGDE